jgi:hypothetical protein
MIRKFLYIILFFLILFVNACEDTVPMEYKKENIVEAFLFVGEPIQNIILIKTHPVFESFNYDSSLYSDAIVKITENNKEMYLEFRYDKNPGFYYPDTTYLVKPETKYLLEITYPDNTIITGETTTPSEFNWLTPPKDFLYYPKDSLNFEEVDSLTFSWEANENTFYYLTSVACLDTLNYGKYLEPQTYELNRRILKPWSEDRQYRETKLWGFIPNNQTPMLWNTFKWFGIHEITIYSPDMNFLKWMLQYYVDRYYNQELGSLTGGMGVFGSASVIRDTTFVIKNQP